MVAQARKRRKLRAWLGILPSRRGESRAVSQRRLLAEPLEDRRVMAVAALPQYPLATQSPIAVQPGIVNGDPLADLIVLSSAGQLTTVVNRGDNVWLPPVATNTGLGTLNGLAVLTPGSELFSDVIVQGTAGIHWLTGNGTGGFTHAQTLAQDAQGNLGLAVGQSLDLAIGYFNQDVRAGLVALSPGTDSVLVFIRETTGRFSLPVIYASGADSPTHVAAANVIGAAALDLVVGHANGSVTFLEGVGDGSFIRRPELTVNGTSDPVSGIAGADVDSDGDIDLAIARTTSADVWLNDNDPLSASSIANGKFDLGLTGWETEIVGTTPGKTAGRVLGTGGAAQLFENDSFLTTLRQTFVVPPNPQTISFELVGVGLAAGLGIPDAFEVSLLDAHQQSLVATHRADATSYFNVDASGVERLAPGVTRSGSTITLDISGLVPGNTATLYFDLVGNPQGPSSSATIDNVEIVPSQIFAETFTRIQLPGSFATTAGLTIADVDGDQLLDVLIADRGTGRLLAFNGNGQGGFVRDEIVLAGAGVGAGAGAFAVTAAPLTMGDAVADPVVALRDANVVMTPLLADFTAPTVSFIAPADQATLVSPPTTLRIQFSEPMQDTGANGLHSVTNLAAYRLIHVGANGVFDNGGSDDIAVPLSAASYAAATRIATMTIAPSAVLLGGDYRIIVEGDHSSFGLRDSVGNRLNGGADSIGRFRLNQAPSLSPIQVASITEGSSASLSLGFVDLGFDRAHQAIIDWGDGVQTSAAITYTATGGVLSAQHIYADNGQFTMNVTVRDGDGSLASGQGSVSVSNALPVLSAAASQVFDVDQISPIQLGTFSDRGFTRAGSSASESFTAMVNWGDGTLPTSAIVELSSNSASPSTGSIRGSHAFAALGFHTVVVTLADDDGGIAQAQLVVEVRQPLMRVCHPTIDFEYSATGRRLAANETISQQFAALGLSISSLKGTSKLFDGSSFNRPDVGNVLSMSGALSSTSVQLVGSTAQSTDGLGKYSATLNYTVQTNGTGLLTVTLVNQSSPSLGGYLTGFLFDVDSSDSKASVLLLLGASHPFSQASGSGAPFGTFDTGAALGGNFLGGGSPQSGIPVSATGTFTFRVTAQDAASLTAASFAFGDGSNSVNFLARFKGFSNGGSDKVPGVKTGSSSGLGIGGSTLVFVYNTPVSMDAVELLGIDTPGEARVRLYDQAGRLIATRNAVGNAASGLEILALSALNVARMEIDLPVDGALSRIVSCFGEPALAAAQTRFFVVDANDLIYRYSAPGADLGDFPMPSTVSARGATTAAGSNPVWVVSEEGSQDKVYVYDTQSESLLGSWKALGVTSPHGIATNGTDLWIVDAGGKRVARYAGSASRRSGSMNPTSSFSLAANNLNATDIATDGTTLWVVDSSADRVFAYSLAGTLVRSWALDPANSDPSGITVNPLASNGIYVLDGQDKRVYTYSERMYTPSGAQLAAQSFALAPGNSNPTGIADPGGHIAIGDVVEDTIPAAGVVVDWTFNATAGQKIYVNFQALSGGTLRTELIAPGGAVIYSGNEFRFYLLDSGVLTLAATGTYTLRLYPETALAYRFQIFDVPPPEVNPVAFGQVISGAIETPGQQDHWTFSGSAGDRLYLNFLSLNTVVGGDLHVDVFAPNGTLVSSRIALRESGLDQSFTLPQDGVYTIVVKGAFNGSHLPTYSFELWQIPPDDIRTIGFREVANGAIEVPGARDQWQFSATTGQNIFLDFIDLAGGDLQVILTAPDGAILSIKGFSREYGLDEEYVLPQTGVYTITAQAEFGGANLNTYQFQIWDIPPPVTQIAMLNSPISGSIVPGEAVTYAFQATAGTEVFLELSHANFNIFGLGVSLLTPDGAVLVHRTVRSLFAALPTTGTYLAVVQRYADDALTVDAYGSFSFRLQDTASPAIGSPDSLGTRFYVGFPRNLREFLDTVNPDFTLSITSAVDTSGTIQIPGLNWFRSYEVTAGTATYITLPSGVELFQPNVVSDGGVLITALDEVAVYGLNQKLFSTDGFTALPTDVIGQDYIVLGYGNTVGLAVGGGTDVSIVATVDNTSVTITPTVTVESRTAHVPFTITMNRGQSYTLHGGASLADLTGSIVSADQPISVFGGNTAARVPAGFAAADHLVEQLPPTTAWGTHFVTVPLATRIGGDTFRILAQEDGTEVSLNGVLVATLARGSFHEQIVANSASIVTSKPALVAQYSNSSTFDGVTSDPFMMLIPPTEQFLSDYTLSTPSTGINANFANLVVPTSAVGSLALDGALIPTSAFTLIGATGFSGAKLPIGIGSHRFSAPVPFGVTIYGFSSFDSYGYFGGMNLSPIAQVNQLTLTPATISLPVNTSHTVTATVTDAGGLPLHGIRVDFSVVGSSTEIFHRYTDSGGQASLEFTRPTAGVDTITATAAGQSATATVQWHGIAPTLAVLSPAPNENLLLGQHLLTGKSRPGTPQAAIVEVTVNGRPVDAFDASGNFFAVIDVLAGPQTYMLAATDSLGQRATLTLDVVGLADNPSGVDLTESFDISASTEIQFSGTTFHRQLDRLSVDMRLANRGLEPLDPTLVARFDSLDSPRVLLSNPDDQTADQLPLVFFDAEVPAAGLATGQTSALRTLGFDNPARERFSPEISILARGNRPPRFVSVPASEAIVGQPFRYAAQAVDPDSQRVIYSLENAPAGMTIVPSTGVIDWTPGADQAGSNEVAIVASDARGGSATQIFSLATLIAPANRPPIFTSAPNTLALPGSNYRYFVQVRDPDGDALAYSLVQSPAGMMIDSATGVISLDGAAPGSYPVEVLVSDQRGGTASQTYLLRVGNLSGTSSPTITSTPPVSAFPGSLYVYPLTAVDPMQSNLTFSLADAPAGLAIDSATGRIIWQPLSSQLGTHLVRVVVHNAFGGIGSQSYSIQCVALRPNSAPAFVSRPGIAATVLQTYSYTAMARDPEEQSLEYSLAAAPTGMAIDPVSGLVSWTPTAVQLGAHRVLVAATDQQGLQAFQQYYVSVRANNTPPTFTSTPLLTTTAGTAYRYNALAIDTEDAVTYSLLSAPASMLIDPRSGAITWRAGLADVGDHAVVVQATDDRGLTSDHSFTLSVAPDDIGPQVAFYIDPPAIQVGQSSRIQILALDDVGVASYSLTIDGVFQSLDALHGISYTATRVGAPEIIATVTDTSGNATTARPNPPLRVLDPGDTTPPFISLTSPAPGATVTYLTDVIGTVTDDNLESFQLEYSLAGANQWTLFAEHSFRPGSTSTGIVDGLLGTFDPTLLDNDTYNLRIVARDTNGLENSLVSEISLDGQAKLGNYRLELTDLNIPLAGIPIQIHRVYDTLQAQYSQDFGYGWSLSLAEARIRESVRISPAEQAGAASLFGANPFRVGTRVYLNAPDGRRVGFTFNPIPEPGFLGTLWRPRFVADPGVFEQLSVDDVTLSQRPDGSFGIYLVNFPYNPSQYTLTTNDQVQYRYDQFQGLVDITNRNSVKLTYTDTGIYSSLGPSITWQRDSQGRITHITDPAGRKLEYSYDADSNLTAIENDAGEVTRLAYLSDPAHYLQSMVDPRGITTASLAYDAHGRMIGLTDAVGHSSTNMYDLANNQEIIGDRLGNESILEFDDRGNVTRVTDPLGGIQAVVFDQNDRPIHMTDPRGYTTHIEYDSRGNQTRLADALGSVWTATYNERNDPVRLTDALGQTMAYEYDEHGNRTASTDQLGRRTSVSVDGLGRATALLNPSGQTWSMTYGDFESPTRTTNPDGTHRDFLYDRDGKVLAFTDESGRATNFHQDSVGRDTGSFDATGRATTLVYADGFLIRSVDALSRVTRYEYDSQGRMIRQIDPLGGVQSLEFDANDRVIARTDARGNQTRYAYDANGRLIRVVNSVGSVSTNVYDVAGNLIQEIDAAGFVTSHVYDALGRRVRTTLPDHATLATTYDALGLVTGTVGPRGELTQFQYDAARQLTRVTDPQQGVYQWNYDLNGNVTSIVDPRGNTSRQSFDARNRLIAATDPLGFTESFALDAVGRWLSYTDREEVTTQFQYDTSGRLSRRTSADGGVTQYEYDLVGNLTQLIDPLGRRTTATYDELDRLLTSTDPRGSVTALHYDPVGNLVSLTDAAGNRTTWAYDSLNRVERRTDPLGNFETFAYDDEALACGCSGVPGGRGNLAHYTDRLGRTTDYSYDSRNRNTGITWKAPDGSVVDALAFVYDASSNLSSASDADSRLEFSYDLNSRLLTSDNFGTPNTHRTVLTNTWDAVGNRIRVRDSDGVTVDSAYDARNLLDVRIWSGTGIDPARVEFDYSGRGQATQIRRYASTSGANLIGQTIRNYDAVGRSNLVSHRSAVDAVMAEFDTDWDIAGQLVRWSVDGNQSNYQYDPAGQLSVADHSLSGLVDESFTYDATGNRIEASLTLGPNNRLLADARFDYSYDAEGNLIEKFERAGGQRQRFSYNHANQMIHFETLDSSGSVTTTVDYRHDAFGRRISRIADADGPVGPLGPIVESFVYDGADVWLDADAAGTITTRYMHGDDIDQPLARYRPGSGTAWYLTDHLGSIRAIASASGAIIDRVGYDSFGNIVAETSPAQGDRYKFTGREWDAPVAMYYYRARMYDPSTGRFSSEDAIGFSAGDVNLARYVGNMPGAYRDPSGQAAVLEGVVGLRFGQQVERTITGAAVGGALGYACGYVEGYYRSNYNLAVAAATGVEYAVAGAAFGAALGFVGASQSVWARYFGGVTGLVAGALFIGSSEDLGVLTIRTACGTIAIGLGRATPTRNPTSPTPEPAHQSCSGNTPASTAKTNAPTPGKAGGVIETPPLSIETGKDILLLGKGIPDVLRPYADALGARVIDTSIRGKALYKHIYREMRKADSILQITDGIPSKLIPGEPGQWARMERILIDTHECLQMKTTQGTKADFGLK